VFIVGPMAHITTNKVSKVQPTWHWKPMFVRFTSCNFKLGTKNVQRAMIGDETIFLSSTWHEMNLCQIVLLGAFVSFLLTIVESSNNLPPKLRKWLRERGATSWRVQMKVVQRK
jgi:hypothetical protein